MEEDKFEGYKTEQTKKNVGSSHVGKLLGVGALSLEEKTDLGMPTAMAVGMNGVMYLADTNNHRVLEFEPHSKAVRIVAGGNGEGCNGVSQLSQPRGIAVGKDGTLYIADTGNHTVLKFTPGDPNSVQTVAGGNGQGRDKYCQLDNPCGLALDSNDNLYIADWGNNRVLVIDPVNDYYPTVVLEGNCNLTQNQMTKPPSITIAPDGTIYILAGFDFLANDMAKDETFYRDRFYFDQRILIHNPKNGNIHNVELDSFKWYKDTPNKLGTGCLNSITVTDKGKVYFTIGDTMLFEFDSMSGEVKSVIHGSSEQERFISLDYTHCVAAGPDGMVYIAFDYNSTRIAAFDSSTGDLTSVAGQTFEEICPSKLGIAQDGSIYFTSVRDYLVENSESLAGFRINLSQKQGAAISPPNPEELSFAAIAPNDTVYFDRGRGTQVIAFDQKMQTITKVYENNGGDEDYHCLVATSDGTIYIADFDTNSLLTYNPDTKITTTLIEFDDKGLILDTIASAADSTLYLMAHDKVSYFSHRSESSFLWNRRLIKFNPATNSFTEITKFKSKFPKIYFRTPDANYPDLKLAENSSQNIMIAVAANGIVYITEHTQHTRWGRKDILSFNPQTLTVSVFAAAGELDPYGVLYLAIAPDQSLLVGTVNNLLLFTPADDFQATLDNYVNTGVNTFSSQHSERSKLSKIIRDLMLLSTSNAADTRYLNKNEQNWQTLRLRFFQRLFGSLTGPLDMAKKIASYVDSNPSQPYLAFRARMALKTLRDECQKVSALRYNFFPQNSDSNPTTSRKRDRDEAEMKPVTCDVCQESCRLFL